MKTTKVQYFIQNFYYWSGYYKIPQYKVQRDNRIDTECQVEYDDRNKVIRVSYNAKRLNRQPLALILGDVLHEIGHIIQNLPVRTFKQTVYSEYRAEEFALENLKKINIKAFKTELKCICDDETYKRLSKVDSHSPHIEAYKRLRKKYEQK